MQFDNTLDVAFGESRNTKHWKNRQINWSALIEKLSVSHVTVETHAEYLKFDKKRQDEIKDVGAFVGGYLTGGRRLATTVAHRQLITLDLDSATGMEFETWKLVYGYAACVYSTHKHTPEKPRLRLVIPLDREVASDEYEPIARRIAEWLGIEAFDITTFQLHRLMYWPSTPKDIMPVFEYLDAEWLSADYVLSTYKDWRDSSEWPVSEKVDKLINHLAKKQEDPLGKPGVIGAFCRSYSIHEAIETFLSEVYSPCDADNRYTYKNGSTAAGLITYDDKFAYSHHGTDPISGMLCNAFDLVRIHKFGLRDEDAKSDTPVSSLPSFKAMQDFASGDEKTRQLLVSEKLDSAKKDFEGIEVENIKDEDWIKLLKVNKRGEILAGLDNIVLVIQNDPQLKGRFIFDEFNQREIAVLKLPWRGVKNDSFVKDTDISNLKHFLKIKYDISVSTVTVEDALNVVFEANKINSVKDYLEGLVWDGEARVERLFIDYLGLEDTEYSKAITRKSLVAAVTRAYTPGVKFDYMLTLVGPQGVGKSTILSKLGLGWFNDTFNFNMLANGNKAYEALQGSWLIEVGELAGLRKAEVEAAKSFLSSKEDRYRVSYGRRMSYFPRRCVFFGTTNNDNFLRDATGNRRFWVAQTGVIEPVKCLFTGLDKEEINQIWAEAVHIYKEGAEELYLSKELEEYAKKLQEEHTEVDEREGLIKEYLETLLPANWGEMGLFERRAWLQSDDEVRAKGTVQRDKVCAAEIWCELLGGKIENMTTQNTKFIHQIMGKMEGWSKAKSQLLFQKYGYQRGYAKNGMSHQSGFTYIHNKNTVYVEKTESGVNIEENDIHKNIHTKGPVYVSGKNDIHNIHNTYTKS